MAEAVWHGAESISLEPATTEKIVFLFFHFGRLFIIFVLVLVWRTALAIAPPPPPSTITNGMEHFSSIGSSFYKGRIEKCLWLNGMPLDPVNSM